MQTELLHVLFYLLTLFEGKNDCERHKQRKFGIPARSGSQPWLLIITMWSSYIQIEPHQGDSSIPDD